MMAGAFEHQAADQIVNQDMLAEFALDGVWIFAAEVVHLKGGFEVPEAQSIACSF